MIPRPSTEPAYDIFYLEPLTDAGFDPENVESLRAALASKKTDASEKQAALFILADKSGRDALQDFKAFLYDKNTDLRNGSLSCVAFCLESEGNDLYEELWEDMNFKDKFFLLQVIDKYGDARFVDRIIAYALQFLKTRMKTRWPWAPHNNTAYTVALRYVNRVAPARLDELLRLGSEYAHELSNQELDNIEAMLPDDGRAAALRKQCLDVRQKQRGDVIRIGK